MKLCLNVINHYSLKNNLLVNLYLSTEVLLIVINQSAVPIETAMNAALKDESLVRQSSDILSNTYLTTGQQRLHNPIPDRSTITTTRLQFRSCVPGKFKGVKDRKYTSPAILN